ncbi:MAG: hypothetical protein U1U88_000506 [Lawsonella clevelandensis]
MQLEYIVAQEGLTNQLFPYNPLDELPTGYRLTPDFEIIPYGGPEDVAQLLEKSFPISVLLREVKKFFNALKKHRCDRKETEKLNFPSLLRAPGESMFTGSVFNNGREWRREDMEKLAKEHGLVVAPQVSKTRCDVLIAADVATQSGKARKAAQFR